MRWQSSINQNLKIAIKKNGRKESINMYVFGATSLNGPFFFCGFVLAFAECFP
jgi:hypothetical protein